MERELESAENRVLLCEILNISHWWICENRNRSSSAALCPASPGLSHLPLLQLWHEKNRVTGRNPVPKNAIWMFCPWCYYCYCYWFGFFFFYFPFSYQLALMTVLSLAATSPNSTSGHSFNKLEPQYSRGNSSWLEFSMCLHCCHPDNLWHREHCSYPMLYSSWSSQRHCGLSFPSLQRCDREIYFPSIDSDHLCLHLWHLHSSTYHCRPSSQNSDMFALNYWTVNIQEWQSQ